MTVLTIPPEVAAECSKKLFALAATANRDSMTLVKQAMALAKNEEPARPLSTLKKYVRMYDQYGSDEVRQIIATIESAADPEIYKRLCRYQAKTEADRAALAARRNDALDAAHALMRVQQASRGLIEAVLNFHRGGASLWDIECRLPGGDVDQAAQKPPTYWEFPSVREEAEKPHGNGNVIAGPWDAGGGAQT